MFGEWLQPSSQLKGKLLLSILFANIILYVKDKDTNYLCLCLDFELYLCHFIFFFYYNVTNVEPPPTRLKRVVAFRETYLYYSMSFIFFEFLNDIINLGCFPFII